MHVGKSEGLRQVRVIAERRQGEHLLSCERPSGEGEGERQRRVPMKEIIGSSHINFLLKNIIGRK